MSELEIVNEVEGRTKIPVETCNFKWAIENFSVICSIKTKEKTFLTSPTFTTGKTSPTKWLALMDFQDENSIGIYLRRISANTSTPIHVSYSVSIVGSDTTKYNEYNPGDGDLYDKNTSWGFSNFIQRKILLKERSLLLLPNNTLTLMFELKVSSVDEIDEATHSEAPIDVDGTESLLDDIQFLYESEMFSDVIIKVGEEELKCHKSILCARSSVFKAMFTTDMKECITNCLEITDFDPSVVEAMLCYIYCGKVEYVTPDLYIQLYSIADKYNLQDLKDICVTFLLKNLNVNNICEVLVLCNLHNEPDLMMAAKKMFCVNAAAVQETENWLDLLKKMPDLAIAMYQFAISQK